MKAYFKTLYVSRILSTGLFSKVSGEPPSFSFLFRLQGLPVRGANKQIRAVKTVQRYRIVEITNGNPKHVVLNTQSRQ